MKTNVQIMINLVMTDHKADLEVKALVAVTFGGFEDIFSSFFGGGSRQRDPNAPRKGDDLQYTMTITFEEAVFGTKKKYQ